MSNTEVLVDSKEEVSQNWDTRIINPNAGKFLETLRRNDINCSQAFSDIIDNSLDAGAKKISIKLSKENGITCLLMDNGSGMSRDTLEECIRLGSISGKNNDMLGKFGVGLKTSALALSRKLTVYTKTDEDDLVQVACQDLDKIIESNTFEIGFRRISCESKEASEFVMPDGKPLFTPDSSGTVVVLSKCDNLSATNLHGATKSDLVCHIGRTFRKFIGLVTIWVNGEEVPSIDPLFPKFEDPSASASIQKYNDIEIKFDNEIIVVKSVKLPDLTANRIDRAVDRESGALAQSGFYIVRNNREMSHGQSWGDLYKAHQEKGSSFFGKKHQQWNRFRAEISFSANLDDHIGINFAKSKASLSQRLGDAIFTAIKSHLQQVYQELVSDKSKQQSDSDEELKKDVKSIENSINSKKNLLDLPKVKKEKRDSPKNISEPKSANGNSKAPRNVGKNVQGGGIPNCKFGYYNLGINGPIMEPWQDGNFIEVKLNLDHPFVQKFLVDKNWDKESIHTAVHYLLYSFATAQLDFVDKPEQSAVVDMIQHRIGFNTKKLLA